jgi:hypothetical protein
MRDLLIKKQKRNGHEDGSWDPETRWMGNPGGRIYATAINALNLEVYYRYLPMYQTETNLSAVEALQLAAKSSSKEMQIRAVRLLAQFESRHADSQLIGSLEDADPFVRLNAAKALAQQGNEKGLSALLEFIGHENDFIRSQAIDAVDEVSDKAAIPYLIRGLADKRPFIARKAAATLRKMTGQTFDFREDAPEAERQHAIARWQKWWAEQPTAVHPAPPEQTITGEVLEARADQQLVMLNIGRDDNVREGDGFTVTRDGEYVGWVKVDQVFKKMSAARIIERLTVAEIRQGDRVAAVRN